MLNELHLRQGNNYIIPDLNYHMFSVFSRSNGGICSDFERIGNESHYVRVRPRCQSQTMFPNNSYLGTSNRICSRSLAVLSKRLGLVKEQMLLFLYLNAYTTISR